MTNFDATQFQSNLYNPLEQDSYSYRITMPSQYEKKLYEQGTLQISEEQQQQIERLINSWTLEQLLTKEALAGEQHEVTAFRKSMADQYIESKRINPRFRSDKNYNFEKEYSFVSKPIVVNEKYQRNEMVTIIKDGKELQIKHKKIDSFIKDGWRIK